VTTQTSNGAAVPATAPADLATLAERINAEHHAAEAALNSGLQHALEAGRLLLEAKAQVGHGVWLPWLERHFEGSPRTARLYVQLTKHLPEISQNGNAVANLNVRQAVKLLAPAGDNGRAKTVAQAIGKQRDLLQKALIEPEPEPELEEGVDNGVGVSRAHEAINCLKRIPKNDRLRKRGFQIVTDWIRDNQRATNRDTRAKGFPSRFEELICELRQLVKDVAKSE